MTAEGKEVAIHCLNIDLEVWRTLGAVHQNGNAVLVGYLNNVGNRVHSAQHIADMSNANEFRALGDVCLD